MNMNGIPSNQTEAVMRSHPDLANAAAAVYTDPRVQEELRVLGEYGLGVYLPHKHGEGGRMVPLPCGEMQSEVDCQVSFVKASEYPFDDGMVVSWRAGPNGEIDPTAGCGRQGWQRHDLKPHPDLANAVTAVYAEPRVQEALRTLGEYGLGVYLPHKHDSDGKMVPLPCGEMQSEVDCRVSFVKTSEYPFDDGMVVGWRADDPSGEIIPTAGCGWRGLKRCVYGRSTL